ncbi:MAG: transposase, partial [Acholeplasmataceae bacterium]|nr:transposase [Acholeplasmataceae bacterium]
MVAIVYQTDKRSGITYAYESISHWDKEKKQSRARRTLIGRVDKITGEIVPTDGRNRKKKDEKLASDDEPKSPSIAHRSFFGATFLLDKIGEKIGVTKDLKQCFPDTYKQVLSIVYYLILEESAPLYRFDKWGTLHKHPHGKHISSQRTSDLFSSITEEDKQMFFSLQGKRRCEDEFWAYDTTSLSSYSETLRQVQYGYNKEHDRLPQ